MTNNHTPFPVEYHNGMLTIKRDGYGDQRVADIRGWGYLTGNPCKLSSVEARAVQDEWGVFFETAINNHARLKAENERLREALEHIADREMWLETNDGEVEWRGGIHPQDIAKQALAETEE